MVIQLDHTPVHMQYLSNFIFSYTKGHQYRRDAQYYDVLPPSRAAKDKATSRQRKNRTGAM